MHSRAVSRGRSTNSAGSAAPGRSPRRRALLRPSLQCLLCTFTIGGACVLLIGSGWVLSTEHARLRGVATRAAGGAARDQPPRGEASRPARVPDIPADRLARLASASVAEATRQAGVQHRSLRDMAVQSPGGATLIERPSSKRGRARERERERERRASALAPADAMPADAASAPPIEAAGEEELSAWAALDGDFRTQLRVADGAAAALAVRECAEDARAGAAEPACAVHALRLTQLGTVVVRARASGLFWGVWRAAGPARFASAAGAAANASAGGRDEGLAVGALELDPRAPDARLVLIGVDESPGADGAPRLLTLPAADSVAAEPLRTASRPVEAGTELEPPLPQLRALVDADGAAGDGGSRAGGGDGAVPAAASPARGCELAADCGAGGAARRGVVRVLLYSPSTGAWLACPPPASARGRARGGTGGRGGGTDGAAADGGAAAEREEEPLSLYASALPPAVRGGGVSEGAPVSDLPPAAARDGGVSADAPVDASALRPFVFELRTHARSRDAADDGGAGAADDAGRAVPTHTVACAAAPTFGAAADGSAARARGRARPLRFARPMHIQVGARDGADGGGRAGAAGDADGAGPGAEPGRTPFELLGVADAGGLAELGLRAPRAPLADGPGEAEASAAGTPAGTERWGAGSERRAGAGTERATPPPVAGGPAFGGTAPRSDGLSVRAMQFNVRDGCIDEPERLGRLGAFVIRSGLDVLSLNEMNGWTERSFGLLAREWGMPHARLLETFTGYHLAIASRFPIEVVARSSARPFHHGLLLVEVSVPLSSAARAGANSTATAGARRRRQEAQQAGGTARLWLCVTHMSPTSARARRAEADAIVRVAAASAGTPFLLLGDLNTLSPHDRAKHARSRLHATLGMDPSLSQKFLDGAGRISYEPMRALLDGGFSDVGHETKAGAYSVPTRTNMDSMHAARMRLDYALANRALRAACPHARASLVHSEETARLSDHYPLLLELSGCAAEAPPAAGVPGSAGGSAANRTEQAAADRRLVERALARSAAAAAEQDEREREERQRERQASEDAEAGEADGDGDGDGGGGGFWGPRAAPRGDVDGADGPYAEAAGPDGGEGDGELPEAGGARDALERTAEHARAATMVAADILEVEKDGPGVPGLAGFAGGGRDARAADEDAQIEGDGEGGEGNAADDEDDEHDVEDDSDRDDDIRF